MAAMKLFPGLGFADVRKQHVISRYREAVARENKNMGDWSKRLKKIYAESEHTADEDPLDRFKKKKKKNVVNVSPVDDSHQRETVTATVPSGEAMLAQSSDANAVIEKPSAMSDNLGYALFLRISSVDRGSFCSSFSLLVFFSSITVMFFYAVDQAGISFLT